MARAEDAPGDSDGMSDRGGGRLSAQRDLWCREDRGGLPRSTRGPVALSTPPRPEPLDMITERLTSWPWRRTRLPAGALDRDLARIDRRLSEGWAKCGYDPSPASPSCRKPAGGAAASRPRSSSQ